jgi:hypothetical protein
VAPSPQRRWSAPGDEIVAVWCAAFVDAAHVPWSMPDRDLGFYRSWRNLADADRRLVALAGGRAAIGELPDDPVAMLAVALAGVADDDRADAVRSLLLRTPGWAGFAKWSDDWAPADHPGPRLCALDLVAVHAAIGVLSNDPRPLRLPVNVVDDLLVRRVDEAVAAVCSEDPAVRRWVADVIGSTPETVRREIWLSAKEWSVRDRLLARLAAPTHPRRLAMVDGVARSDRPNAQFVFCIDVRSEPMRRRIEQLGAYETYGFAGFFGVPVRWRPLGSEVAQARCPVLVSPRHEVAEAADVDAATFLSACSADAGLHDAFHSAKGGIASPFALAESAGWIAGPIAAARTLVPHRRATPSTTSWWRRRLGAPGTRAVVGPEPGVRGGLSLEERTLFAEANIATIGMTDFAPIVVLCGHGSRTTNNPHASSLDCGACGGAPGGASARIAATILDDPLVRAELCERGIEIPDDTVFVAAEHDTASDRVTLFDTERLGSVWSERIAALRADLERAGERNAAERARRLPGRTSRARGRDWAQVRPEWGLAGNAAFVIGPRSITERHDLAGRCFLHSYRADLDPDGVALETIMTAPLIVAQWISAQYYFSTVDPEVFGAGDKMLHNPVGGVGVVVGQSGDLAVGLPLQSVMLGEQRAHEPVRLLAVVEAPLDRIDQIVARNTGLRQLVDGSWIHVVARGSRHGAWMIRTINGWEPWNPADPSAADSALLSPLEIT